MTKFWMPSFLGLADERPIPGVCEILEKFTCMVYAPKSSKRTLQELQWELFRLKVREGEKLPPTLNSFLPHLWRANYKKNVTIRCIKPAAPEAMLASVKCGCKRGCSEERHCVCLRNALPCTNASACNDCENKFLEKAYSSNDSDDEEDEEGTEQTA